MSIKFSNINYASHMRVYCPYALNTWWTFNNTHIYTFSATYADSADVVQVIPENPIWWAFDNTSVTTYSSTLSNSAIMTILNIPATSAWWSFDNTYVSTFSATLKNSATYPVIVPDATRWFSFTNSQITAFSANPTNNAIIDLGIAPPTNGPWWNFS
jgi:hypothetical protein